jgi:hypothetical protein
MKSETQTMPTNRKNTSSKSGATIALILVLVIVVGPIVYGIGTEIVKYYSK